MDFFVARQMRLAEAPEGHVRCVWQLQQLERKEKMLLVLDDHCEAFGAVRGGTQILDILYTYIYMCKYTYIYEYM